MNKILKLTALAFLSLITINLPIKAESPLQITQNNTQFTGKPPAFIKASVPHSSVGWSLPWYYFTLNLPAEAEQSLGQVTITPGENSEIIDFNLAETTAFIGENSKGEVIKIAQVTQDSNTQTITITFAEPISPNTLFTIRLQAKKNPNYAGTYLFRIKALPEGVNPVPLDLGVARLNFYSYW